jgi:exonuclease SbcC
MVPVSLTIQGLYSYRKITTINFQDLTKAGVFGIFGPVGSGKSSILEAITFVLFGHTERMHQRDNRNYNMMNLRSDEMKIEFIFRNNNDTYRFTSRSKRNKNNYEDITVRDRSGYIKTDGKWIPLESADAEHVLGLKYDEFKQIVIIPQGKFNEFVQKTPGERTKMIQELFPLDKFDVKSIALKLSKENNTKLDTLKGQLQELEEYSEEKLKELNNEFESISQQLEKASAEQKKQSEEVRRLEKIKEDARKLTELRERLEELHNQKEEIGDLKKQLDSYQQAVQHFKPQIERLTELENDLNEISRSVKKNRESLEEKKKQLAEIDRKSKEIEEKEGTSDEIKDKREQADKAVQIKNIITEKNRLQKEIRQLSDGKKAEEEKRNALKKEIETLREQINQQKKSLPDEQKLYELASIHSNIKNKKERLEEEQDRLIDLERLIEDLKEQRDEIVGKIAAIGESSEKWENLKTGELVKRITQEITSLKSQKEKLEEKRVHFLQLEGLSIYADTLNEGEECPLCGSVHHPDPYSSSDQKEELDDISSQQKQLSSSVDLLQTAHTQLKGLIRQFKNEGGKIETQEKNVEKLKVGLLELENKKEQFSLNLSAEEVDEHLKDARNLKKEIENLEKQLSQKEKKADSTEAIDQINQKLNDAEKKLAGITEKENLLKDGVDDAWFELSEDQLAARRSELEKAFEKLEKLTEGSDQKSKERDKIEVILKEKEDQLKKLSDRKNELKTRLEQSIEESDWESRDEIESVLNWKADIETEQKRVQDFEMELNRVTEREKELTKSLKDSSFNEEIYKQKKNELDEITKEIKKLTEKRGSLSGTIEVMNSKLKLKTTLLKEQVQLEKRGENLSTMNSLFRGDEFIKYVSTIYLQQLCYMANERFQKLTQNQLQLDIDEDYNFVVRDFLNNGKTRLLKTLSGGQTFQAALCLALALSEQIQAHQNVKQQFFFMDEGFGSLDKASLSLVFDSLKQLRKENRTVGIISHVEELQNEIDYYLDISIDEQEGSEIRYHI